MTASSIRTRRRRPAVLVAALGVAAFAQSAAASIIGGWVYVDRDNNGQLTFMNQSGQAELVIGGIEVRLFQQSGTTETFVSSMLTDAQGRFLFSGLADGFYTLRQTQPIDWVDGLDTPGVLRSLATGDPVTGPAITTLNNEFRNVSVVAGGEDQAGRYADGFLFGERGLTATAVTKRYLISTAPPMPEAIQQQIPEPTAVALALAAAFAGRRRR
jgi:hypothetical protein